MNTSPNNGKWILLQTMENEYFYKQGKMNTSTKFCNISIREKAKNHGLKHIIFLLSEV